MRWMTLLLPAVFLIAGCARSGDTAKDRNRETVRAVFTEVWSKGNVNLIEELFSERYVGHFPGDTVHGTEELAAQVRAHRTAFPDWTEKIEDEIVDGDRIAVRFTSRGTNRGKFLGKPPTGRSVEISEVAVFRFTNGRISEQWVYPDILSLQRQLRPDRQE